MGSRNFRDLIVWQKGIELIVAIHELTSYFPRSELFGITDQMRRSAVSIPSNIAEGSKRGTKKDFRHFLRIANGSGAELETLVEAVKRLQWSEKLDFTKVDQLLNDIMKLLNRLLIAMSC